MSTGRPLLAKVLAGAVHDFQTSTAVGCRHGIKVAYDDGVRERDDCEALAKEYLDFTAPDVADRLEWALDVCTCGVQRVSYVHLRTSGTDYHPYQPLVQP